MWTTVPRLLCIYGPSRIWTHELLIVKSNNLPIVPPTNNAMINSRQTDGVNLFRIHSPKFLEIKHQPSFRNSRSANIPFSIIAAYSSMTFPVLSMTSSVFKYFSKPWILMTLFQHFQSQCEPRSIFNIILNQTYASNSSVSLITATKIQFKNNNLQRRNYNFYPKSVNINMQFLWAAFTSLTVMSEITTITTTTKI